MSAPDAGSVATATGPMQQVFERQLKQSISYGGLVTDGQATEATFR
jgi:hypothetical protein